MHNKPPSEASAASSARSSLSSLPSTGSSASSWSWADAAPGPQQPAQPASQRSPLGPSRPASCLHASRLQWPSDSLGRPQVASLGSAASRGPPPPPPPPPPPAPGAAHDRCRPEQAKPAMATVRPISPQYQHTLDSAISLAKELASKNMADSGDSSPKTPNSPDKRRFNFKLKHFSKSFSEASANIRDIESSISYEAKRAYKSLIERGPFNSCVAPSHHSHTMAGGLHSPHSHAQYVNDDLSPTSFSPTSRDKKHFRGCSTFSAKKSFF